MSSPPTQRWRMPAVTRADEPRTDRAVPDVAFQLSSTGHRIATLPVGPIVLTTEMGPETDRGEPESLIPTEVALGRRVGEPPSVAVGAVRRGMTGESHARAPGGHRETDHQIRRMVLCLGYLHKGRTGGPFQRRVQEGLRIWVAMPKRLSQASCSGCPAPALDVLGGSYSWTWATTRAGAERRWPSPPRRRGSSPCPGTRWRDWCDIWGLGG